MLPEITTPCSPLEAHLKVKGVSVAQSRDRNILNLSRSQKRSITYNHVSQVATGRGPHDRRRLDGKTPEELADQLVSILDETR